MADSDGRVLEDFYTLGKELGRGAFAVVYLANENESGRKVAVKKILKKKMAHPEVLVREVSVLKETSTQHPNINTLIDLFETSDTLFLVLDYVEGGELFDHIVEVGNFSEQEAIEVTRQVLSALEFLHSRKIAHRDIKPENLLCNKSSDGKLQIQIADFGLSRFFEAEEAMETRVGSPEYVAPEVLEGKSYNERVDMWSCGVVVYILLTGFLPFYEKEPNKLYRKIKKGEYDWDDCPDVSDLGKEFVSRLLITDPDQRLTAEEALQHKWIKSKSSRLIKGASFAALQHRQKGGAQE
jgi:calcium/calmodulin-dependent protein kinase I